MALFRRQPDEAERILLQASPPLVYRAIKINMNAFRWLRALDLAVKHKTHLETVLFYRQKFLRDFQREEHDQKFLQHFGKVLMSFCHCLLFWLTEESWSFSGQGGMGAGGGARAGRGR